MLLALYIFFIGAAFGSFFLCCYHRKGLARARSACPICHKALGALELVPVISYLIQKGKCKVCGSHIPISYLLFEILFGIFFVLIYGKLILF